MQATPEVAVGNRLLRKELPSLKKLLSEAEEAST
jgi:hypothetical protein